MKKITLLSLSITLCLNSWASSAKQLITRLHNIQEKGIMFGHQDDTFYGTTWKWEDGRSDVKDVCGDYPAVLGVELGKIELGSDVNIDGVPFERMKRDIVAHHQRGGIITISWHPWNPVTGNNSWDPKGDAVAAVLPGGAQHNKMVEWTKKVISFIKSLKTSDGESIPVILRPWHEMTGGWFWWGCNSCTPEQYRQLFRMTYDQFAKAKVKNVVWSYSPGADAKETEERFMTYYPGDKYVDVLGVDAYQYSSTSDFISLVKNELAVMKSVAQKHKKLYALTEAGYRNTPQADWFTQGLLPAIQGSGISYVLLWRNAWDQPEENFGPAPEKSSANDFKLFYNNPLTLFVRDIEKIK